VSAPFARVLKSSHCLHRTITGGPLRAAAVVGGAVVVAVVGCLRGEERMLINPVISF